MSLTPGDDGHVFGLVGGVTSEVHPEVILGTALQFFIAVGLAGLHRLKKL